MAIFGGPKLCNPKRCGGDVISRGEFLGRAKLYSTLGLAGAVYLVHATDGKILVPATAWLEELAEAEATNPSKGSANRSANRSEPAAALRTPASAAALLRNPRLQLAGRATADLRSGIVDPRLVALLTYLLADYQLTVGIFKTGHRRCVAGTGPGTSERCRVSQHWGGHACDIGTVNGRPVTAGSRDARRLVATLAELDGALRPTEVGSPFAQFAPLKGFFTDGDHHGHIHLGVDR